MLAVCVVPLQGLCAGIAQFAKERESLPASSVS